MALLGSLLLDGLAAVVLFIFLTYLYATSKYDFFKKRGVAFARPVPFFGSFFSVVAGRTSMMAACVPYYEKFKKNRIGGVFIGRSPVLMVCDPELVKTVLTKDFSSLHDRGIHIDEENDPMTANLANVPGARWKNLRMKLTPAFTSGKLKMMFPLMKECSNELTDYLRESARKGEDIEMVQIIVRFCADVVGTCAFGIQCNAIRNPKSEIYTMTRSIFQASIFSSLKFALLSSSKLLMKLLPFKWFFTEIHDFFLDLMKRTVALRKENNVERNDFVQLLIEQQKKDESKSPKDYPDEVLFTDVVMAAQAFVFYVDGLDSIANVVGLALYHITIDPRLQEDLADEVTSVIRNNNGELTYEALQGMKLCERILSEALRMYTPGGTIFREVTSPKYTIPGSDITLKKGAKILIPAQGIHYDPDIYPEPHKFDPDRFTEEAISRRHPYAYIPFGEGPRICIANRFVKLDAKLCLASLVKDFKFSVCPETQIPLVLEARAFGPTPKNGIYVKIEERSQ